jgi:peroxiredoxin
MSSELSLFFSASYLALWVLVIVDSLVLLGVVRIVYQLQLSARSESAHPLRPGKEVPAFVAADLYGGRISTSDLAGRVTALLFVSPDCEACTDFLEILSSGKKELLQNLILVCRGAEEDCARLADQHHFTGSTIGDKDAYITRLYGISRVPTAVVVDADLTLRAFGSPPAEDLQDILASAPVVAVNREV